MKELPHQKAPCINCPFRKTALKGWLGSKRAEEIAGNGSFVCHKKKHLQCAGHMLLLQQSNQFVSLASMLKIPLELKGREQVFDTTQAFIKHHDNEAY